MHLAAAMPCAAVMVAALSLACPVRAEIYGWVDPNGSFTYSNLPPPESARVTDVIPDEPAATRPSAEASRLAQIAALNDRIRLLELERARDRSQFGEIPPPSPALLAQPASYGCATDSSYDCSAYGAPFYYVNGWPVYYGARIGARAYPRGSGYRAPPSGTRHGHGAGSAKAGSARR